LVFLLDLLLPQIWTQHRTSTCPIKKYQELVEMLKITPRQWNKEIPVQKVFKYISTVLNININLITFQYSRTLKQQNLCEHAKNCLIPVYKFQNPTVKLVYTRNNYFTPVHIIEHKQKFYSFNSLLNPEFNPFLIKCNPTTKISFAGEEISLDLIENVLRSKPVKKQFSIVLYSAFSLVKSTSNTKQMAKLLLGFFNAQTENPSILYLFIIPHLENSTFTIVQIFQKYKTPLLNPKTIFHTSHFTEGESVFQNNCDISEDLLDQESCICEHPDTERYFLPDNAAFFSTFQNLGKSCKLNLP
jgi:hypothetical protein